MLGIYQYILRYTDQVTVYTRIWCILKYIQQYTRTSFVYHNADTLQDFVEAIVTPLCRRSIPLSQNQSLWREILTHAQRTKSILSGLMQETWKRGLTKAKAWHMLKPFKVDSCWIWMRNRGKDLHPAGERYPSLVTMLNREEMLWQTSVRTKILYISIYQ